MVMLGELHMEMALWNTLGDVFEGSGWTTALIEADIASSGQADSFLKSAHLTRTRNAHQITVLTLHNLQKEAFMLRNDPKDFESAITWRNDMLKRSPTFEYWDLIMRHSFSFALELTEQKNSLCLLKEELTPLFFALDHVNYSRWMSVHTRDVKSLPQTTKNEFEKCGHWVLSKTTNKFSTIPFDQAREHENKIVKSSGGVAGLTENPAATRRCHFRYNIFNHSIHCKSLPSYWHLSSSAKIITRQSTFKKPL